MNQTVIIAMIGVFGGSILLMIPFLLLSKKRKGKETQLIAQNKEKAIMSLYCRKTSIDGIDLASFAPIKGQYGQQMVALDPGTHAFTGIFETTDVNMGKNINLKSQKLNFEITLVAGAQYTLAIYLYSPEERKAYYSGDVGQDIFSLPLSIDGRGESSKAYIICYREDQQ